jgi:hypothetical protein
MGNLKLFLSHLEDLQSKTKNLTETGLALNALFAEEETRLKWENEASRLRAVYRTIVEQLERIKRSESSARHRDTGVNLIFSLIGLAATIIVAATTKNQRAWNIVNNVFDTEGHKKPFGTVMVCVGQKGLPDNAHVVSISQLARESNRPQTEIMNKLQDDGYLLFSEEAFSLLIDKLIGNVREGKLRLPLSREKLVEITGLNKQELGVKITEVE